MGSAAPGLVIAGKYRIERPLGAGACAEVFLAQHCLLGTKVAIKLLSNWRRCSNKQMSRFIREAQAAAKLRSEHVCRVVDVGRTAEGAPFTVLEYLEGTDLQHVLTAHDRIDAGIAVDYLLQVCEGVAEAHANGIVHRDLKPANLFLTTTVDGAPLVKILDFGISKQTTAQVELGLTGSSDILGTPYYMSPEQLRAATEVDARTDIWSIGVILWRMISGEMPFEGASFAELCVSIITRPPRVDEAQLPPGLAELLLVCLEKDPEARYQDVHELAAALSRWRSGDECTRVNRIGRVLSRFGGGEDTVETDPGLDTATGETTLTLSGSDLSLIDSALIEDDSLPWPGPVTASQPAARRPSYLTVAGIAAAVVVIASVLAITLSGPEAPARPPRGTGPVSESSSVPSTTVEDDAARLPAVADQTVPAAATAPTDPTAGSPDASLVPAAPGARSADRRRMKPARRQVTPPRSRRQPPPTAPEQLYKERR